MHVDGAGGEAVGADSPDVGQQLVAGDGPFGVIGQIPQQLDLALRVLILAGMLTLGLKGLTAADSVVPGWLSTKFLLFAAIIGDGIVLRWISGQWYPAIARLQAGDTATGEEMLRVRRRKAIVAALTMWLLIAAAGFIGTLKP